MKHEPILIADGTRGIYAPREAARNVWRMIQAGTLTYSGHTVTANDLSDARTMPADSKNQTEAWDAVSRGIYYVNGHEHRIHEDEQGIFLIPDGYDMEQR